MPPKVVCIVGPTGCGKTGLGVALAERLGGEVVSCDSMQLYRGMVIGTAAPTEAETRGVPHHMVGVIDPREDYSVARYAADAAECVDGILARGKLPILVGGTGLYLDALLRGHGYAPGTTGGETRRLLERRWDDEGGEVLFAERRPRGRGEASCRPLRRDLLPRAAGDGGGAEVHGGLDPAAAFVPSGGCAAA